MGALPPKVTPLPRPLPPKVTLLTRPLPPKATLLTRPLPPKAIPFIRLNFRGIDIVEYYNILSLKRDHASYKDIFSLQNGWSYKRGTTVLC
jgi:hypothetical protein